MATLFSITLCIYSLGCLLGTIMASPVALKSCQSDSCSPPNTMTNVGSIDGKQFFTDTNLKMEWIASGSFCSTNGMKLATISTPEQKFFLKSKLTTYSNYHFWVDGRDALPASELVLNPQDSASGIQLADIYSCLSFYPGSSPLFHGHKCTDSFYALCETVG